MPVNLRGFSSLLPEKVTVQYRTRCCSGVTSPPNDYQVSVTPRDVDFAAYKPHKGSVLLHDSAYAIFNGGDKPINEDRLLTLTKNIARDLFEWRSNQGDKVFAGIIAPEMTALDDQVEWQMDDTGCSTTQSSGPYIQEADRLLHHDPTGFCKVPCDAELIYGGSLSISGAKARIPIYSVHLDDDNYPPEIKYNLQAYSELRYCCESSCNCLSKPKTLFWTFIFETRPNPTFQNGVPIYPPYTVRYQQSGTMSFMSPLIFPNCPPVANNGWRANEPIDFYTAYTSQDSVVAFTNRESKWLILSCQGIAVPTGWIMSFYADSTATGAFPLQEYPCTSHGFNSGFFTEPCDKVSIVVQAEVLLRNRSTFIITS